MKINWQKINAFLSTDPADYLQFRIWFSIAFILLIAFVTYNTCEHKRILVNEPRKITKGKALEIWRIKNGAALRYEIFIGQEKIVSSGWGTVGLLKKISIWHDSSIMVIYSLKDPSIQEVIGDHADFYEYSISEEDTLGLNCATCFYTQMK